MGLLGMIATWDFCLFLLGSIGVAFFMRVQQLIAKCNPKVFGLVCTIMTYLLITYMQSL